MNRTGTKRWLGWAALLLPLASLGPSGGAVADDGPVTIGAMYNLTGGQRELDEPSLAGVRLAVDLANADDGVLGREVTLIVRNGESEPATIADETRSLLSDTPTVAGFIGFSDTDMVLAAAPLAAEQKHVFVTSGATSPLLPRQVPGFLFLACFGDNVQAAAGAEWAHDALGARTAAVLYREGHSYTELLHGYFTSSFEALGDTVLAAEPYTPASLDTVVRALPEVDLVYLAALPDDVAAAVPLLRQTVGDTPILGGDGLDIGPAWAEVEAADKVYFTTHVYLGADNPDPAVQQFRADFAAAYPGEAPHAFAALGFDAARLLLAAIDAAGSTDGDAVRQAMAGIEDFAGVTGTISFAAGSQIPDKPVTIMAVNDRQESFVATVRPTRVPPPN